MAPKAAIVGDVGVRHQQNLIAHDRGLPFARGRVNRRVLPHHGIVPDPHLGGGPPEFQILGDIPDDGAVVDLAAWSQRRVPLDDGVEANLGSLP